MASVFVNPELVTEADMEFVTKVLDRVDALVPNVGPHAALGVAFFMGLSMQQQYPAWGDYVLGLVDHPSRVAMCDEFIAKAQVPNA